jgi:hypothetical protein
MISGEDTDKHLVKILRILQKRFDNGDKSALLYAFYYCCLMKRPLPEWLRLAFLAAYHSRTGYEIKSWDDVFGQPHPKGTHIKKQKRHFELRHAIMQRVEELQSEKTPIDKKLFEKVGKDLGIGGSTTVSDIYYEERRRLKEETDRLDEIRDRLLGTSEKK